MSQHGEMATRKKAKLSTDALLQELRAFGLTYPGTSLKSPWPGHLDLAVKNKTFAYLSIEGDPFSISCKLPRSNEKALMLPGVTPTAYGLGRAGWVTAHFADGDVPPAGLLRDWIDESYRAQAPKKLVAAIGTAQQSAPARKPKRRAQTKPTTKAEPKPKRGGAAKP